MFKYKTLLGDEKNDMYTQTIEFDSTIFMLLKIRIQFAFSFLLIRYNAIDFSRGDPITHIQSAIRSIYKNRPLLNCGWGGGVYSNVRYGRYTQSTLGRKRRNGLVSLG